VTSPRLFAALLASLLSCGDTKTPAGAADRFVDKYYVESDQQAALALSEGMARMRLENELRLVGTSRRGLLPGSHAAKVYYDRKRLEGRGATRTADYALHIKPQGGSPIEQEAHLELRVQPDGTWRVSRFNEGSPR
jgi:hypothetical protein